MFVQWLISFTGIRVALNFSSDYYDRTSVTFSNTKWRALATQSVCCQHDLRQGQWLPGYRSIDITGNNTSVVRLWPHDHTPTWHVPRWFRSMQFTLVLSVTYLVGSWSGHTSPAAVQSKLYSQWVTGPFHSSWKKNKKKTRETHFKGLLHNQMWNILSHHSLLTLQLLWRLYKEYFTLSSYTSMSSDC